MFSVIVPAYNSELCIERALISLLNQSYKNFEIIVIDDGSNDNTVMKVKAFNSDKIKVISQINQGVSSARNLGIKNARYDYICFLDSDDEWMPNRLEILIKLIKLYPIESVYITTNYTVLTDGSQKVNSKLIKKLDENFIIDDLFKFMLKNKGEVFNTNSVCVHKSVFMKVGLFEVGIKNGEDSDMWSRISAYYDVVFAKEPTTIRHRDFSTATSKRIFVYDYIFDKRIPMLLADQEISDKKKRSIAISFSKRKLSSSRNYLLDGDRKKSINMLKSVSCRKEIVFDYFFTTLCQLVPPMILKAYIRKKYKDYYK